MKQVLKNIFTILNQREKQKLWMLAIADIFISILDIGFLVALLLVINFYTQAAGTISLKIFPTAIFNEQPVLLMTVFFGFFALKNLFGFFIAKMQYHFVYDVASRLSKENLLKYLNGSYLDYVNIDSSIVNRKISQQPIEFCHYVLNGMQQVFSQVILIAISIIAILIFNPLLFPLLVLVLAPAVFLIAYFMKRKLDETRIQGKKTSEQSIQHLQEALTGFVESNIYSKNEFFTNRYHRSQSKLNHYLAERHSILNIPPRLIEVFAIFGLFALIVINHFTAHSSSIPLITIGAFMAAAYKIIPGIVKIMNSLSQVKTYAYSSEGFAKEIKDAKNNSGNEAIRSIAFENISFSYPGKKILDAFSFRIEKADMIGVSGLSGKGKTTIVHILLGFLNAEAGNVYINENIAGQERRQSYWNKISYIKQQPFFIHASIIKNITLEEQEHDPEKIKRIIQMTGLDKLISDLPMGLETIITENGKNFSGGQRQRIIFARALYKDCDLLILDEPFNELDEASEIAMLKQLQAISNEGKMILLITHNKTALSFCNKKIDLDEQQ